MQREELISEAAKAIRETVWQDDYEALSRAALAVFEKAYAPTDDERVAVARAIHDGPSAVLELATMMIAPHGFEECTHKETYLGDADAVLAAGFRRSEMPEPQGEPSDAQLQAAAEAFSLAPFSNDEDGVLAPLRAALRAAGGVR